MRGKDTNLVIDDPWRVLRRFTGARIALGRAGVSLPTASHLEFELAHAQARDAVHLPLAVAAVEHKLSVHGYQSIRLHSAARDRSLYLQRPDLGRKLDKHSLQYLEDSFADPSATFDIAFVIADGLSALAIHQHAAAFLATVTPRLHQEGWSLAPVALVEQGRVAIGDEIAAAMHAAMVAVLIGERPGLSSPDSLGVYFTYNPRLGCTDADRNCISNIRKEGLSYAAAAHKLYYLISEARRRQLSGVKLKDEAGEPASALEKGAGSSNFLTDG